MTTEHIPLTEQEVAEIEARANAATPGPWRRGEKRNNLNGEHYVVWQVDGNGNLAHTEAIVTTWNYMHPGEANADLIAAAPTDILRLIADWRELRRLLVELSLQDYDDFGEECRYCAGKSKTLDPITHAPDCPIARAREMLGMQHADKVGE